MAVSSLLLPPLNKHKPFNVLPSYFQAKKPFSPSIRCKASSSSVPMAPINLKLLRDSGNYDDVDYCDLEVSDEGEDPRPLSEIWREIQGSHDWQGLIDPMNSHLRREILRYGEFSQACYDSFDFDPHSIYCGSCKFLATDFFHKMDMSHYGYTMCRYLYATSNINLPNFFQKSSIRRLRSLWSPHANWMGYVAVASDEDEIRRLGRRDIVISWRGTVTYLEWIHDLKNILCPAHFRDNPHVQIESGFYDLYTTKEDDCRFCSFSARQQVLAEVKRLVERYKGDDGIPLSITVTGHSLGAALALLTAYDIAEMRLNVVRHEGALQKIPVSVFSFASPRVGNLRFKDRCDELGVKVLRIINVNDKVPTVPGLIANEKFQYQKYLEEKVHFPWSYAHVGTELALDHTHSPFLKTTNDVSCAHNLEAHLHLVDGYRGKNRKFSLANKRDIALVNKDSNLLKPEYGVPPFWRQDHNKGMIRGPDGRWVLPERPRVEANHPEDTEHHFDQGLSLMSLTSLENVLFNVSNLAMKGAILVGELPASFTGIEFDTKASRDGWMDKTFLTHGFRINVIAYEEIAGNLSR